MLSTIQTTKETIYNDNEHFLLTGCSKDFETWGFLLKIDAKLCFTSAAPSNIHGNSVAESIFPVFSLFMYYMIAHLV